MSGSELGTDCFTCAVNSGREQPPGGVIYEDDLWIADHGVSRLVAGYVVLKPKRHVHELADLESRSRHARPRCCRCWRR